MVETSDKPLVVVTGITGYLGMFVCRDFLKDGSFRVRGTVRSKDPQNLKHLKEAYGKLFDELELSVTDIENEAQVEKAVAGATFVVHTASPVLYKEPTDGGVACIKTAVEGALITLRASSKAGVKRVVLTSSIAAVRDVFPKDKLPDGVPYTEENWSDVEF
jgi:nucleoside-diphosphate-sugar epimerase